MPETPSGHDPKHHRPSPDDLSDQIELSPMFPFSHRPPGAQMADPANPAGRFAVQIEDLRRSEPVNSVEFLTRTCLVLIAAACGWFIMEIAIIPIWVLAYYALVTLEKTILRICPYAGSTAFFGLMIAISMAIATVFAILPVYLWRMEGDIWKFGAIALLIGGVLNVFLLRSKVWQIGVAYIIPISIAIFVISFEFYEAPIGGPSFWSALVLAICLSLYFGLSIWEAHRSNEALRTATAQFVQAQKLEALGTLTSGVAHDFNNILSVVLGNLELTKLEPEAHRRDGQIDEAIKAVLRGKDLTKQLLLFGRHEKLEPVQLNVADVLQDVSKLASRVLPATINLIVEPPPKQRLVYADQAHLFTALLNLIINARDALPDGGTILFAAMDRSHKIRGPDRVIFCVRDDGIGIPDEIASKVLDPFFTTKPSGKGSGLGLAMVANFAQRSGGELTIESVPGAWTEVCLALPWR